MTDIGSDQQSAFTVSQLNRRARQLLETHFPLLWVVGEISNLATPGSGHVYFTLKDDQAQIRAAMFRNRNERLNFKPENGNQVLVRGRVGLYEGRGEYQLIVEHMEEAGFGLLQRQFEALKSKLFNAGLFDESHKKPLPRYPRHLGVITSATGAALQDVISVLARRFPALPVSVYPAMVQGDGAAKQLCDALERANRDWVEFQGETTTRCDVLLLTRGGGSLEDLWPFNEESLAYAIYQSQLPVVSAVGHEIDITIADYVADIRAPTPSAAAELISPDQADLLAQLEHYQSHLARLTKNLVQKSNDQLLNLSKRLRHPKERIQDLHQRMDNLDLRLSHAMERRIKHCQSAFQALAARIKHRHPENRLRAIRLLNQQLESQLHASIKQQLAIRQQKWQTQVSLLNSVSPLKTLERGYAITSNEAGNVITTTRQVNTGDNITARVTDGTIHCSVIEITQATAISEKP